MSKLSLQLGCTPPSEVLKQQIGALRVVWVIAGQVANEDIGVEGRRHTGLAPVDTKNNSLNNALVNPLLNSL